MIQIDQNKMQSLVTEKLITQDQSEKIWAYLQQQNKNTSPFNVTHFFYYFGGLVCVLAMFWFAHLGWEQYSGAGLTLISLAYLVIFTFVAKKLWSQKGFELPAGILYTLAVCMTPFIVYGLQRWIGYWSSHHNGVYIELNHWIKCSWLPLSISTVIVSIIYLRKTQLSFLSLPLLMALFFIAIDIPPLIHGSLTYSEYDSMKEIYSVLFGLITMAYAFKIDDLSKLDFSYWLYLVGLTAFWGGLTFMNSDSEVGKFIYFLINVGLLFLSLFLYRRIFMFFGAMGIASYLWHLAAKVFEDSLLFPVVMTLFGLGIMYLGMRYQKNKNQIDQKFSEYLPAILKKIRPQNRPS